jgi:hypothetical protein
MFETMACSSKFVDPITMVGLLDDAPAGAPAKAAGRMSVEARAASAPKASARVQRMRDTLSLVGWRFRRCDVTGL